MEKFLYLLAAAGAATALLFTGAAIWVAVTIPSAPDPTALPSHPRQAQLPGSFADLIKPARAHARALTADERLPGLSVAVAVAGEIVWAEGLGWADSQRRRQVTPDTRFRVGGISAAVTSIAAGLLHQRGELDLDAPVARYVPGLAGHQWPVSVRQLLSHTAGLRAHRGEGGLFQGASCADDAARLALAADELPRSEPGAEVRYSTFGPVLVGAVIAAVADESYEDFVAREVLGPLNMRATGADTDERVGSAVADLYYPRLMLDPRYGLHDAPAIDLSCYLPAVGFLSTPSDLVRLGSALLADGLLSAGTRHELLRPGMLASGDPSNWALGWSVARFPVSAAAPSSPIFGHGLAAPVVRRPLSATTVGGAVAGSTATLLVLPEYGLAVAVATNISGAANVPLLARHLGADFARALSTR